jgi:hypothetical protein
MYTRVCVVEESSAEPIIDNTERCGIAADHREMCRFARNNDPGFRTVIAALKRYAHEAPDLVAERCKIAHEVLEDERGWQAEELRKQLVSSEYVALLLIRRMRMSYLSGQIVLCSSRRGRDSEHAT